MRIARGWRGTGRRLTVSPHHPITPSPHDPLTLSSPRRRAFSLLEMMLVVVIIGLLAGVVVFQFAGQGDKARISTTKTKMKSVMQAIDSYIIENGTVPPSIETLTTGTTPYLKALPKDAWRNDFVYYAESNVPGRRYTLISLGPDGFEGSEDDIDAWVVEQEEG